MFSGLKNQIKVQKPKNMEYTGQVLEEYKSGAMLAQIKIYLSSIT